jgi:hypothetical protein
LIRGFHPHGKQKGSLSWELINSLEIPELDTSTQDSQYMENRDVSEEVYGSGISHSNRETSSDLDVSTDLYGSGSSRGVNIRGGNGGPRSRRIEVLEGRYAKFASRYTSMQTREILEPWSSRRRLDGEDLVHVALPAENRYSWEEERISRNEESLQAGIIRFCRLA